MYIKPEPEMSKIIEKGRINQTPLTREGDSNVISGTAIVFNQRSQLIGGFFYEEIKPGALEGANMEDVLCRTHHDDRYLTGRTSAGTLTLEIDSDGCHYRNDVAPTSYGKDLVIQVGRKEIRQSSFAFSVAVDGESWSEDTDGIPVRFVEKISRLFDVAPVVNPAYVQTTVQTNGFVNYLEENKRTAESLVHSVMAEKAMGQTGEFIRGLCQKTGIPVNDLNIFLRGGMECVGRGLSDQVAGFLGIGTDVLWSRFQADGRADNSAAVQARAEFDTFRAMVDFARNR